MIAGVVVWDVRRGEVLEERVARVPCRLPYIPGLLSFREAPGILAAIRKLDTVPEVVLCDAQGIAHRRRLGLASHVGLWLQLPTVGCAKSRLCGEHADPARTRGSGAELIHKGERVGTVLRTRDGVKPLFISPGHLCDHDASVRLTLVGRGAISPAGADAAGASARDAGAGGWITRNRLADRSGTKAGRRENVTCHPERSGGSGLDCANCRHYRRRGWVLLRCAL